MIRRNFAGLMMGVALIALVDTAPALAQAADDSGSGDIIVTARRTEERLQDVPISITVFNQEQISNRNVVTATDLATYTPSLSVNQRFGPEKSAFSIRGFVQDNATAPSVGVYFADVVFTRAQGGTTAGATAPVGSFMDLQNVQVLKGPQGTLFGRNTTGGAVLLVPNRPTDKLEGWIEGSAGDYGMIRGQAVLNVPLADTFKIRLAVDRNKRGGYMKNHSGIGPDDYNDVNYVAGRLGILADLTPDLESYTLATYSHSFSHGYGSRLIACDQRQTTGTVGLLAQAACDQIARQNARGDSAYDVEINNPSPLVNLRAWQVINTTTWRASDTLTVKNIVSYSEFRERLNNSLNGDNFFVSSPVPGGLGLPATLAGTSFQHLIQNPPGATGNVSAESGFTEELQLQGSAADGRLDWQLGGYLELNRPLGWSAGRTGAFVSCASVQDLNCTNPLGIGSVSQSSQQPSFTTKAIYAQATYDFTPQLSLTAGGRYTWDTTKVVSRATRLSLANPARGTPQTLRCNDPLRYPSGTPGTPKLVTSAAECVYTYPLAKSDAPTWMIDLEYKPTSDLMVYGKYSRGYRMGGINPTNLGFEEWQPEKVDTYELGAKLSFRGAVNGYVNVTGFYNDFSNQQLAVGVVAVQGSGFNGSQAIVNAGKSRLSGVEVDSSATFFDSLRFDLGYTYLDTVLKSFVPPTIPAELNNIFAGFTLGQIVGGPLALSPKHRLTLTGTYTLPLAESLGKISVGATYVYTSSQFFSRAGDAYIPNFDGTAGAVQFRTANFGLFGPNISRLPATNIVNLNVNWNNVLGQPVDLAFFVTNLTKEVYPVAVLQNLASGYDGALYGAPRMWGFRLRYSFGD